MPHTRKCNCSPIRTRTRTHSKDCNSRHSIACNNKYADKRKRKCYYTRVCICMRTYIHRHCTHTRGRYTYMYI